MSYTLTTKSQVTLPKSIRDHLKVAPGDAVEFRIVADGTVRVEPARTKGSDEPDPTLLEKYRKLQGSGGSGMSTDEWMNLLRGYDEDDNDPGFAPVPHASSPASAPAGASPKRRKVAR